MIDYTARATALMKDLVARVPALSHVDMSEVLVFARFGRLGADGPFATCHCLTLPDSEPGYYFWRDRRTGHLTRRSEWFVTRSPQVMRGATRIKYLISLALPRFCDQTLRRSRKAYLYPSAQPWLAKLDTVVHELYHIDPSQSGIRRFERADGSYSPRSHGPAFYEQVAQMVQAYLASGPDPSAYDFLRHDFSGLRQQFGRVVGTTFNNFPSFPQRYDEAIDQEPSPPDIRIVPVRRGRQPIRYTERDLASREFRMRGARRLGSNPASLDL